ncbi:MAG: GAF domain-containing protein [Anaerolineales bacterium]|nr:GAF domain-containing protein [Anaerolineales bacterium]MCW5855265.1 GAF domain-containing protein [Anaerolineales bacterium]
MTIPNPVMEGGRTQASLDLLYHISRELASALDLRVVLERVLKLSMQNVIAESGSLIVLDDHQEPIDSIIIVRDKVIQETTRQLKFTLQSGLAGWVATNRKAALVPDTSQDERWQPTAERNQSKAASKSVVSAPLIVRDKLVGVVTLTHPQAGFFNADHLNLVQVIADLSGFAVLNARYYAESQRRAAIMTAVADSAKAIGESLQLDDVLQTILEQTARALEVQAVALALVDGDSVVFRAASGELSKKLIGMRMQVGQGLAGWVAQHNEGLLVPDVDTDPRYFHEIDAQIGLQARAIATSPIRAQQTVIGVLQAINPVSGELDNSDLLVLEGIGNLAGTAIEHAQLFEQMEAARSRYLELFEDSIDPILITDLEGNIVEANRQAHLLLNLNKNHLQTMNVHHFHQADSKVLGKDMANLKDGQSVSYESVLQAENNADSYVEVYVRRIDVDGLVQLQWILRDITERKNLDTLREDLASMIYHDLRSPLANVVSGLDVLAMMLPADADPTMRSVLDIAMRSTERIQRLVNSLLDTSRMESGQKLGSPEPTAVASLAQAALEAVTLAAQSKQVELVDAVVKGLPRVMADSEMIRRVLINLLENAIRYSKGGMSVVCGAKRSGDFVEFWVQDQGRGIPKSEHERIFDKFTRVQPSSKSAGKTHGLGLGLAYCKLTVEGHGGRIWVESEPDNGARFAFTLPIARTGRL